MGVQTIESIITTAIPDCQLEVMVDGNKVRLRVVSIEFEGLSRVKRQQKIYGLLDELIKSGEIHAVTMLTLTPEEASR